MAYAVRATVPLILYAPPLDCMTTSQDKLDMHEYRVLYYNN